jgi:hypothetical protein
VDEQDLSDFQRQQAQELPHREQLYALVAARWTTPESDMALENLKNRQPGLAWDQVRLEEECRSRRSGWTSCTSAAFSSAGRLDQAVCFTEFLE